MLSFHFPFPISQIHLFSLFSIIDFEYGNLQYEQRLLTIAVQ